MYSTCFSIFWLFILVICWPNENSPLEITAMIHRIVIQQQHKKNGKKNAASRDNLFLKFHKKCFNAKKNDTKYRGRSDTNASRVHLLQFVSRFLFYFNVYEQKNINYNRHTVVLVDDVHFCEKKTIKKPSKSSTFFAFFGTFAFLKHKK